MSYIYILTASNKDTRSRSPEIDATALESCERLVKASRAPNETHYQREM